MSHYSLIAIGFENEEDLENMMSIYDESRKVAPHIDMTKEKFTKMHKLSIRKNASLLKHMKEILKKQLLSMEKELRNFMKTVISMGIWVVTKILKIIINRLYRIEKQTEMEMY